MNNRKNNGDNKESTPDSHTSVDIIDRKWIDINIPCKAACPIMTDIPGYIQAIMEGDYQKAYLINRMDNVLPGVLGRVCNRPCETVCRHGRSGLGDPVSICFLKRSAADFGMTEPTPQIKPNGKKICIIGAGPAGLTAANDLALNGYNVTVLEQFSQPGGMLRYGIPQFRLPYDIVAKDVESITRLGVEIRTDSRIPSPTELEQLKKDHDAVIIAGGCMLPKTLNLTGKEADGVFWGIDFMMAANNENEALNRPMENVVVIGGGFTSVDCARMAYRLGAKKVTLAYRRTKDDMYVGQLELEAMEAEGIHFSFLASPVGIESETQEAGQGKNQKATGVKLVRNAISPNGSVTPIDGSEFIMEADTIILAIGQKAEEELRDINNNAEKTGDQTTASRQGHFFVAGDFRNGASTVIEAAADGRKTAREVHRFLSGIQGYRDIIQIHDISQTGRSRDDDFIPRQPMDETALHLRRDKNREVELGFSKEKALIEARRCYLCHYNFQIDIDRCIYCLACIDVMPVDCIKMAKDIEINKDGDLNYIETKRWDEVQAITIDNDTCIRCGNCVRACPVNCISISKYALEVEEVKGKPGEYTGENNE